MTAAAIPARRGLDAPNDRRRCAPAQGADRAPDPQGAAVVPLTFHEQFAAAECARERWHEFPGAFAYEQTDIPRRADDPRVATDRVPTAPSSPAAAVAVEPIQMSAYLVIVTEHRTRGLVDRDGTTYISPPQSEQQARCLVALLAGVTAHLDGGGPWRHPVAGGQRVIELERQR